jgi:hypothetical protein
MPLEMQHLVMASQAAHHALQALHFQLLPSPPSRWMQAEGLQVGICINRFGDVLALNGVRTDRTAPLSTGQSQLPDFRQSPLKMIAEPPLLTWLEGEQECPR